MKRKMLLVTLLVSAMVLMAVQPAMACNVPPEQRIKISMDIPVPIGDNTNGWAEPPNSNVIRFNQLPMYELPIVLPGCNSQLYGLAWLEPSGCVNFKTGVAKINSPVTIEFYHPTLMQLNPQDDCNGFWGNMAIKAKGLTPQNMDNVALKGQVTLYGYGVFDGSDMKLNFVLCQGVLHLEGYANVPLEQQPLWASMLA